ncbi:hypothetical protein Daus18300_011653 [Diaporthe australafricana]|uniref:F-box domain-containing protein n=1 Tax=Diaporthe australafricana TaxID=127596 RepID=A0ABR3W5T8_9PEZI
MTPERQELARLESLNASAPANSLLGLPAELQWAIYDLMFTFDARTYVFYVEGRQNLIIDDRVFDRLQRRPQLPRIARVCSVMRSYTLDKYSKSTCFLCAHFDCHGAQIREFRSRGLGLLGGRGKSTLHQMITQVYNLTAFFNFDCDVVAFEGPPLPFKIIPAHVFRKHDTIFDVDEDCVAPVPQTARVYERSSWLFAGSGLLDHTLVENWTKFETFVWSERDKYISQYPEVLLRVRLAPYKRRSDCTLGHVEMVMEDSGYDAGRFRYWNAHAEFIRGIPERWDNSPYAFMPSPYTFMP